MRRYQILSVSLLVVSLSFPACAQKGAQAGNGQQPQRDNRTVSAQPVIQGDPDTPPAKTDVAKDRITIQQLKEKMDANEEVIILDVRSSHAWDTSSVKIRGAIRVDPEQVEAGIKNLPKDKLIVTYCT